MFCVLCSTTMYVQHWNLACFSRNHDAAPNDATYDEPWRIETGLAEDMTAVDPNNIHNINNEILQL